MSIVEKAVGKHLENQPRRKELRPKEEHEQPAFDADRGGARHPRMSVDAHRPGEADLRLERAGRSRMASHDGVRP